MTPEIKQQPAARERFLRRQSDFVARGINLVEVDVLRCGEWSHSVKESLVPEAVRYPYRIIVRRTIHSDRVEFYVANLREPLPIIPVPLRNGEQDAILALQPLIASAWENGDYSDIRYATAPYGPFQPADDDWIGQRLAEAGFPRIEQ